MSHRYPVFTLIALLWLATGTVYVWAGWQQKQRVNLSAAAGGQYPYLIYAGGIAREGVAGFFGDRNRMPLYPSLLALFYDEDWDTFVDRSTWFAIASSLIVLIGIAVAGYLTLPLWPATALTMTAVVCLFIHNASFVQAELMYYGLLYACWLVLCRVIHRPDARWAAVGGAAAGVTYLTKASALPVLAAFAATMCVRSIVAAWKQRRNEAEDSTLGTAFSCNGTASTDHASRKENPRGLKPAARCAETDPAPADRPRAKSVLLSTAVVALVFLAVVYPYISNSKARFGRYFYNVNSTFFMWCDSWAEAKSFADKYEISKRYPEANAAEIPSPVNYWRTHTPRHLLRRLEYGARASGSLGIDGAFFKYIAAAVAFCVVLVVIRCRQAKETFREYALVVLFCGLFFGGYLLAFAWYAQVAHGDRFLLSLFLPAMFSMLWFSDRLSGGPAPLQVLRWKMLPSNAFAIALVICLAGEGAVIATKTLYEPGRAFVQFYYNESRELQTAGNLAEGVKGFEGVLRLDPKFAPAHHGLGMIALTSGRFDDAVASFRAALQLDSEAADVHNSLGSALIQTGRTKEAIVEFKRATELDPHFARRWFNLGGSYCLVGTLDKAEEARRQLDTLDAELARRLAGMIAARTR